MKLFGKELFKKPFKQTSMYDFAQHGLLKNYDRDGYGLIAYASSQEEEEKKKKIAKVKSTEINPKKLYQASALNNNDFKINTDPAYIKQEVKNAEQKVSLIYSNRYEVITDPTAPQGANLSGGSYYGKFELESIIERLNNRLRVKEFKDILEKYPHTTNQLINEVVKAHSNLRCSLASSFIPDMPQEAVAAMTEYNEMCVKLTGKKTHFYVIADKKDFGERDKKRDPILLAQSPFGFFWQILGAWDEEMVYLGDL